MSLADYIAVHGEPTPVKTTYHRCHLCQAVILFTRSRLTTHLSKHKVTVRDYGNSYLSRVRSEKKLKISHVSSLATESHQQFKVTIEKETTGSSTTVLPPSRS